MALKLEAPERSMRSIAFCTLGLCCGCETAVPERVERQAPVVESPGPAWADKGIWRQRDARGEISLVSVGVGVATEKTRARQLAAEQARSELAAMIATRIRAASESVVIEKVSESSGSTRQETRSVLEASSSATLRRTSVQAAQFVRTADGHYRSFVQVAIPERMLFPWLRLLELSERGSSTAQDYFRLARDYETEGFAALAERALRTGYEADPSPRRALRVAQFYRDNHDAVRALEFADLVLASSETEANRPARQQAKLLARSLTVDLPSVRKVHAQLLALADERRSTDFLGDVFRGAAADYRVSVRLEKRTGHRFLLSWLEPDEITPNWVPLGEMSGTRDNIDIDGPTDSEAATLLVWALPKEDAAWSLAHKLADRSFAQDETTQTDRLMLREFVRRIRASDCVAVRADLARRR